MLQRTRPASVLWAGAELASLVCTLLLREPSGQWVLSASSWGPAFSACSHLRNSRVHGPRSCHMLTLPGSPVACSCPATCSSGGPAVLLQSYPAESGPGACRASSVFPQRLSAGPCPVLHLCPFWRPGCLSQPSFGHGVGRPMPPTLPVRSEESCPQLPTPGVGYL